MPRKGGRAGAQTDDAIKGEGTPRRNLAKSLRSAVSMRRWSHQSDGAAASAAVDSLDAPGEAAGKTRQTNSEGQLAAAGLA